MIGGRKEFSQSLYNTNDKTAKLKTINILRRVGGYTIIENPKKRGVDLLVYKDGEHVLNIEAEIKRVWRSKKFPYDNVQFPERKEKFAQLDLPTIFLMFNHDLSTYLCVLNGDLLDSPKKMVSNRFVRFGEYFFQVPEDKVFWADLKGAIHDSIG